MSEANDTQGTSLKDRVASLSVRIRGMSKPALILIATTLVAALGLAAWLGVRASSEPYAVLFGRLSPEDAASVAEKLKEMKAPYKVGDAGTIEVPESRVHELRLEVAGAGLPRGGGVGFESFDKMKLGATEFEQQVMFRRAMEGELARTITSVSAIESARVHLVLPEKSVFVQKRELGSASVIVKLQPGRDLGPQEIGAIVHLVSSAVPGLAADRVTLATTEGALLRKPKSGAPGADIDIPEDASASTRSLETSLEERVKTMLDKVLGAGHADVKVRAEMDFSQVERTEDKFKPKATALRSEELLIERTGGGEGDTVAGVPGAESNLPTGDGDTEAEETTATPGVTRRQHTRNFEVDRVTEKRVNRVSTLKRLTVAVAVDGISGVDDAGARTVSLRDPEELEQIEKLVRSAVGADDRREDLVTVECIPFSFDAAEAAGAAPEAPAIAAATSTLDAYKKHAPYAVGGAIGLAAIVMLLTVRRARKKARERASLALLTATPVEKLLAAEPVIPALSARSEALRRAEEDPATAALVIRHWLGGAEQETQRAAV